MNTDLYNRALLAMQDTALKLGVRGVAGVCIVAPKSSDTLIPVLRICGRFERPVFERGETDKGTNYLGVTLLKFATSFSRQRSSGPDIATLKMGEIGFKGCVVQVKGSATLFAFFSGGSEEDDVQIANAGMSVLLNHL